MSKNISIQSKRVSDKNISIVLKTFFERFYSRYHGKIELNECVYDFAVDDNTVDNNNVWNIHNYLMKKHDMI